MRNRGVGNNVDFGWDGFFAIRVDVEVLANTAIWRHLLVK